jgi:hypothetical protein
MERRHRFGVAVYHRVAVDFKVCSSACCRA